MSLLGLGIANTIGSIGSSALNTGLNIWQADKMRNFNASEAEKARAFSAEQASLQRDFEERMSSTSYQRAIEDMKKAGLNVGALGGSMAGASTPSGATAQTSQASSGFSSVGQVENPLSAVFNSAIMMTMSNNKNFTRELIENMRESSALALNEKKMSAYKDIQGLRNQGFRDLEYTKKVLGHRSYFDLNDKVGKGSKWMKKGNPIYDKNGGFQEL